MEKFTIAKPHALIPCLAEIPADPAAVVIVVHGFTSRKESDTARLLLTHLPPLGFGVIAYDQPAHGSEEALEEPLRIANCLDSLAAVEAYAVQRCPNARIGYFSSSFGAYITGLYISTRDHKGDRAFFRSAAVNMPQLMNSGKPLTPEQLSFIEENGYLPSDPALGPAVRVPPGMLDDLRENDLFELFAPGETKVRMVHGEDDPTVKVENARRFAEKFSLPLTVFPGEGHSLCNAPETPETVAAMAAEWYRG